MTITEPMTMATDYVLAAFCLVFGITTARLDKVHRSMILWALTFFAGAASGILGGTHHGFKLSLGVSADKVVWDTALLLIGATGAFMLCAAIVSGFGKTKEPFWRWMVAGLVLSVVALVIQKVGWDIDVNFNHNDIHHVTQTTGFCCLFKGAMILSRKQK
jgi:hypothetical protein